MIWTADQKFELIDMATSQFLQRRRTKAGGHSELPGQAQGAMSKRANGALCFVIVPENGTENCKRLPVRAGSHGRARLGRLPQS